MFSALDSSIQYQSVRDCYTLGKFFPCASRPRPLLVKFVRAADVSKIFARKKSLSSPLFVKPDFSQAKRVQHSTLMQERWCLIQSVLVGKTSESKGMLSTFTTSCMVMSQILGSDSHQGPSNSPSDASPFVQNHEQCAVHVHTSLDKSITSVIDKSCSPDN